MDDKTIEQEVGDKISELETRLRRIEIALIQSGWLTPFVAETTKHE